MIVELQGVSKAFGEVVALDSMSLTVESGEVLSVLGPSGSGKTTLLRVVAGLLRPDKGRVLFDGTDVTATPPQERKVGLVFQSLALFPHMNVWDNVAFPLDARGWSSERIVGRVSEMIVLTRLEGLEKRYPRELSGGQQQRVALARALAPSPQLLLFDEPLASLDVNLRAGMLEEIKRLQEKTGVTTIYVTHDQAEALAVSDYIALLFEGRVEASGPPLNVYLEPPTSRVAEFLGATNVLEGRAAGLEGNMLKVDIGSYTLKVNSGGAHEEGETVRIIFRPEDVAVSLVPSSSTPLHAILKEAVFLGRAVELKLTVNGSIVRARIPDPSAYNELSNRVGGEVYAGINGKRAMLYRD